MKDFDIKNNEFIAMLERNIRRLRAMIAVGSLDIQLDKDEPNRADAIPVIQTVGMLGISGSSLPSGFLSRTGIVREMEAMMNA